MTLFGIDISNNNGSHIDMAQVAAEGFSFVFCKVSEGDYFADATWPGYRDAARAAGLLTLGYHYAIASCDPQAQAATFAGADGGGCVMIDFEDNSGNILDYWRLVHAFNAVDIAVVCSYVPHWYWQQIGSPDLSAVSAVTASSYVGGSGYASVLYPGDDWSGWAPYGGAQPRILQFTDRCMVAGHSVDANAFRGDRPELAALLGIQGGLFMALTDNEQNELLAKTREIWDQLRGPGGQGWPQLGTSPAGGNLTPVDKLAEMGDTLDKMAGK